MINSYCNQYRPSQLCDNKTMIYREGTAAHNALPSLFPGNSLARNSHFARSTRFCSLATIYVHHKDNTMHKYSTLPSFRGKLAKFFETTAMEVKINELTQSNAPLDTFNGIDGSEVILGNVINSINFSMTSIVLSYVQNNDSKWVNVE